VLFPVNELMNKCPCSSFISGGLARPSDGFPDVFTGQFWKQYPYFLPCFVVAVITILSILVVILSLKEVVRSFWPLHLLTKVLSRLYQVVRIFQAILSQIPPYYRQTRISPLSQSGKSSHTRLFWSSPTTQCTGSCTCPRMPFYPCFSPYQLNSAVSVWTRSTWDTSLAAIMLAQLFFSSDPVRVLYDTLVPDEHCLYQYCAMFFYG